MSGLGRPWGAGPLLVLADDLSGAAECAAAFACPDAPVRLTLADSRVRGGDVQASRVAVLDLDARDADPRLDLGGLGVLQTAPAVFVKVDSLLRGRWAGLLGQMTRATGRPVLLCPALPRLGRGVRNGRLHLTAAERGRIGQAYHCRAILPMLEAERVSADVLRQLQADLSTDALTEALVDALSRQTVTVVDAVDDNSLYRLAVAAAAVPDPPLLCGSAGFLNAIARLRGAVPAARPIPLPRPAAVLVGSLTPAARRQLHRLSEAAGVPVRRWCPSDGILDHTIATSAPLRLFATDPEVDGDGSAATRRAIATSFVRAVLPRLADVRTVIATGGETARALCDAWDVRHLEIVGELEQGVCLARLPGSSGRLLVIKSGSFGDDDTLLRLAIPDPTNPTESSP
jgi:uncharacterized protein YgbK (DUF1537 family)